SARHPQARRFDGTARHDDHARLLLLDGTVGFAVLHRARAQCAFMLLGEDLRNEHAGPELASFCLQRERGIADVRTPLRRAFQRCTLDVATPDDALAALNAP